MSKAGQLCSTSTSHRGLGCVYCTNSSEKEGELTLSKVVPNLRSKASKAEQILRCIYYTNLRDGERLREACYVSQYARERERERLLGRA